MLNERTADGAIHAILLRASATALGSSEEDLLIARLLQLDLNYEDDLPYACRPEQNTNNYNSNSYAARLLRAASITEPRFPNVAPTILFNMCPGWWKPVPREKFGLQP